MRLHGVPSTLVSGQRRQPRPQGSARKAKSSGGGGKKGRPPGKWSTGWRLWFKRLVLAGVGAVVLALVAFVYAYARMDIPEPNAGFRAQTTYVYYSDGKTVIGKFAEQDRTNVSIADVPDHVEDAVIAAEDRSFWTNSGIDPKGIVRAAFNNAQGGDTQGASTITQQYVKILYLTSDRTFTRKAKEAILSVKIHRQMSKDEILQGYLNTIYFGRGAYGVEAAARAYFGIPASKLNVSQGAALAAIINSPNNYDPADGKKARKALRARYNYVIDGMDEMGTLPSEAAEKPGTYKLPKFPERPQSSQNGGQRGHMLKLVRDELVANGFTQEDIYSGGLRVTTSFTRKAMDAAAAGVDEVSPGLKGLHAAVASVEPETGALRGFFAGQDYLESEINWAKAGGAPGSTFKPFALAAALEYGYSLQSRFNGNSPLEVGDTEFTNQGEGGGRSYGSAISLLAATEDSVNTAYVEMAHSLDGGASAVRETAVEMGISEKSPGLDDTLSIVLGSATVSVIDMANAYGTIAADGVAKDWWVVDRVTSADDEELYTRTTDERQAISRDVARDTSYALQQVAEVGTGTNANVIGRPIAAKTGTATDDDGNVRSSWFVGYTPQLSTAVMYVRGNGNAPLNDFLVPFFGGEYPAKTWAAVMSRAMEGEEVVEFPPPAELEQTVEGHEPLPTNTPAPPPAQPTSRPGNGNGGKQTQEPEPTEEPEPTQEPEPTEEPEPEPTPEPSEPPIDPTPPPSSPPPSPSPTGNAGG